MEIDHLKNVNKKTPEEISWWKWNIIISIIMLTVPLLVFSLFFDTSILLILWVYGIVLVAIVLAIILGYFLKGRDIQTTATTICYKKGNKMYEHHWNELASWRIRGRVIYATFMNGDKVILPRIDSNMGKYILNRFKDLQPPNN